MIVTHCCGDQQWGLCLSASWVLRTLLVTLTPIDGDHPKQWNRFLFLAIS